MTCGTPGCGRELQGEPAKLEQSQGSIAATLWRCECGWACKRPVRPTVLHMNGYTASRSPCRRKTDVQPR
jgi:hypothetical protein